MDVALEPCQLVEVHTADGLLLARFILAYDEEMPVRFERQALPNMASITIRVANYATGETIPPPLPS